MKIQQIEIKEVLDALDVIKNVNSIRLNHNTLFTYKGKDVFVDEDLIEDFKYTGLGISSFIDMVLRSRV